MRRFFLAVLVFVFSMAVRARRVYLRASYGPNVNANRDEGPAGHFRTRTSRAVPSAISKHPKSYYSSINAGPGTSHPLLFRGGEVRARLAWTATVRCGPRRPHGFVFFSYDSAGIAARRPAYIAWHTRNMRSSTSWSISAITCRASFLSSPRLSSGVAQPGNSIPSYLMP